ncbi:MAG: T9SS type A sorting domain-containing protein [Saprospiraceae bacterium]|nr:T9SS type A sorting domain-containing protein [Saprospiraceae bacterium]
MKQFLLFLLLSCSLRLSATVIDTIQPPLDTGNTTCNNCPFFMPDNFTGEAIIEVTGAVNNDLADSTQGLCGVYLNFDHEYIGDLTITLVSPAGQQVQLIGSAGFYGMTDGTAWQVYFLPCSSVPIPDSGFSNTWDNNQPWGLFGDYHGSYYPNMGCMESLDTGTVNGTWRLIIVDAQAIDVGNMYQATLFFCDNRGLSTDSNPISLNAGLQASNYQDWSVQIYNTSLGATSFQMDWGDGTSNSGQTLPTIHEYPDTGTYTMRLIATNGIESDTAYTTITIHGALPLAGVNFDGTPMCLFEAAQIEIVSEDHVNTWLWHFPHGNPEFSSDKEPIVIYDTIVTEYATLVISNNVGADTLYFNVATVGAVQASFNADLQGNVLLLENTSVYESNIYWYVNEQFISSIPVLVFPDLTTGTYEVRLVAENVCSTDDSIYTFVVVISDADLLNDPQSSVRVYPNPRSTEDALSLSTNFDQNTVLNWDLVNALGQKITAGQEALSAGAMTTLLQTGTLPVGVYWLNIQVGQQQKAIKVIVQKK